jgi:hypothetical protein
MRMRGGGDDGGTSATRHEPWSQTPDVHVLQKKPLPELVGMALKLYRTGRHPTPNVYTKNGNVRDRHSSNGSTGRIRKFVEREIDPTRVRARTTQVARAQDVVSTAVFVYTAAETVAEMLKQLIDEGPPDEDSDDDQAC